MIIIKLIISPKERTKFSFLTCFIGEKWIFLTSFSFLTCFRVEIDISYRFHKIYAWNAKFSFLLAHVKKDLFHAWEN